MYLFNLITIMMMSLQMTVFDFSASADISGWEIVDDVVMGGRSGGSFALSLEGTGVFSGKVSLENNGGFSSVRYDTDALNLSGYDAFILKVKGDGKRYQFRVKSGRYDRQSYISYFETNGEWQEILLPMEDMYPTFRGMRLNMDNYPGKKVDQVSFLIGNNRTETFRLEIDEISVIKR
jgi:hypothetical protein